MSERHNRGDCFSEEERKVFEELVGYPDQNLDKCDVAEVAARRITELEADCAEMAEDVIAEAAAHHSDGHGGIHPALLHKYRRDISTASKYTKTNEVKK